MKQKSCKPINFLKLVKKYQKMLNSKQEICDIFCSHGKSFLPIKSKFGENNIKIRNQQNKLQNHMKIVKKGQRKKLFPKKKSLSLHNNNERSVKFLQAGKGNPSQICRSLYYKTQIKENAKSIKSKKQKNSTKSLKVLKNI